MNDKKPSTSREPRTGASPAPEAAGLNSRSRPIS